ncbi:FAST kinase domain-containing protein 5, mitochondrial-like [Argonauta hians]
MLGLSLLTKRIIYSQGRKDILSKTCNTNNIIHLRYSQLYSPKICLYSTVSNLIHSQINIDKSRQRTKTVSRRRPVSFGVGTAIYKSLSLSKHIHPVKCMEYNGSLNQSNNLSQNKLFQSFDTRLSLHQLRQTESTLVANFSELNLNEKFLAAHLFFSSYFRCPKYLSTLFEYVDNAFDDIINEPGVLKLTLFYIYFHGSGPETLLQKIEDHLPGILSDLSANEIGLICLGYFRANRRIFSYDLLDAFAERTLSHLKNCDPHQLINVLKAFRHAGYCKESFFERFALQLISDDILDKFNLNQVMHILMAFASSRIKNPDLIHVCLVRALGIVKYQSIIRSKEIGRIVWAVGTLGVSESDISIVETLINIHSEIEDQQNNEYPESVCDTVMGSIFLGIFPQNLINYLMKKENVQLLQGLRGLEKKSQLLLINNSTSIECPTYTGLKLDRQAVKKFQLSDFKSAVDFELKTRAGLRPIYEELVALFGDRKVECHMILPHFTTSDIELHLDADNSPLEFKPSHADAGSNLKEDNQIHHTVTENLLQKLTKPSAGKPVGQRKPSVVRRIVIEVAGPNQCSLKNPPVIFGTYRTKLRQLELLGYEVLLVTSSEAKLLNEKLFPDERKEWIFENIIKKCNININNT